ncbi:response regulator [uncultured Desulfobacter sp.]|uniref:response regulator n=1 Tax=uncultured Desulfobacter sp. TaxID=240139 RepID=UPI0029F59C01|nr:response regulator [uncultured Desulfobacter sp.]
MILIVEDEKKIAALIADYLQAGGFIVAVVSRGDQVLEYIEKEEPALIILDIMLLGMDGIEVCKQVRQRFSMPILHHHLLKQGRSVWITLAGCSPSMAGTCP